MFGEAAKLIGDILHKGKAVNIVTIYGILVAAHNHQYSKLLKLKINFEERLHI